VCPPTRFRPPDSGFLTGGGLPTRHFVSNVLFLPFCFVFFELPSARASEIFSARHFPSSVPAPALRFFFGSPHCRSPTKPICPIPPVSPYKSDVESLLPSIPLPPPTLTFKRLWCVCAIFPFRDQRTFLVLNDQGAPVCKSSFFPFLFPSVL